jgi:hypothetical protein
VTEVEAGGFDLIAGDRVFAVVGGCAAAAAVKAPATTRTKRTARGIRRRLFGSC